MHLAEILKENGDVAGAESCLTNVIGASDPEPKGLQAAIIKERGDDACLLYTSPSPRDRTRSRMPSSA